MQRMWETGPTLPPQGMPVLHSLLQLLIFECLVAKPADGQRSSDRFVKLNGVSVQSVATVATVVAHLWNFPGPFLSLLLSLKC